MRPLLPASCPIDKISAVASAVETQAVSQQCFVPFGEQMREDGNHYMLFARLPLYLLNFLTVKPFRTPSSARALIIAS